MKRLLYMPVLAIALIGCENKVCCDYGEWIYRRSFAMYFYETSLKLLTYEELGFPDSYHSFFFRLSADNALCGYDDIGDKKELYDSFCEKYGDMTYNREEFIPYDGVPSFLAYSPVSLDIVSDAPFDEKHSAGESLADIAIFDAESSMPFIDSGYTEYDWGGMNGNKPFYPVRKKVSELTAYDLMLLYGMLGQFHFESLPTLSKEHTFTVTFTDERGDKFSDSVQMTFE